MLNYDVNVELDTEYLKEKNVEYSWLDCSIVLRVKVTTNTKVKIAIIWHTI